MIIDPNLEARKQNLGSKLLNKNFYLLKSTSAFSTHQQSAN